MIDFYGISKTGSSHLADGRPCQDAHGAAIAGGMLVLAVADGVGSESASDVGAHIAVDECVAACAELIATEGSETGFLEILGHAFARALDAVENEASESGTPAGEMDCTLCCAIWDPASKRAYIGQSGDSGALCSHGDGSYELLTEKQNDEEGRVFCLCFADHWVFSDADDVWSLALCTDGVLDAIMAPPRLKAVADMIECNGGSFVDARMARAFLHPQVDPADPASTDALCGRASAYLDGFPPALLSDDKTVLVGFDTEALPGNMPEAYYAGPKWGLIDSLLEERLYGQPQATVSDHGEGDDPVGIWEAGPEAADGEGPGAPSCDMPMQPRDAAEAALRAAGSVVEAGASAGAIVLGALAERLGELAEAVHDERRHRGMPPEPPSRRRLEEAQVHRWRPCVRAARHARGGEHGSARMGGEAMGTTDGKDLS